MKNNWQTKKLCEVCKLLKGKKPSKFVSKSSKPYLTAKVVRGTDVPEFAAENCSSSVWGKKDDIVIIMDGSNSGEMFTGLEGALASTMGIVRYDENLLSPKFLLHFLVTHRENFTKSRTGSAIPHLNKEEFEYLEIPLPPLFEQNRIVKILDEVFERIAKVKENAEKNLQNSKELFESYLQSVFENKSWEHKKLNEISENLDSKRIPITKNVRTSGKYPYYGASGIVDYVDKYIFDDNLLLVSEDGANLLARSYPIAFSINGKTWVNNHAHVLKFEKIESQRFIEYYLNSIKLDLYVSGMAQPKLNQKMLNLIPIPYPSLTEQKSIVAKLDVLSTETKKLEAIYQQKLADLEELKKSVLKKAFSGEL